MQQIHQNIEQNTLDIMPNLQVNDLLRLGIRLTQTRLFLEAEQTMRKILSQDSLNPVAIFLLNLVLKYQNRIEEADEVIDLLKINNLDQWNIIHSFCVQELKVDENNHILYYMKGFALNEQKKYQAAIESLNKAIQIDKSFAYAYINKSYSLYNLKKIKEEIFFVYEAVKQDPLCALARFTRGSLLFDKGYYKEALGDFDQAIKLCQSYSVAFLYKGRTLIKLNQYEEAIKNFSIVLQIKPKEKDYYQMIYYNLVEVDLREQASIYFDQYVSQFPNDNFIERNKCCLRNLKKQSKAKKQNTQSDSKNDDKNYLELFEQGYQLMRIGKYEEAIKIYDEYLIINPDDSAALFNKGYALFSLEMFEEANQTFNLAIQYDPNDYQAYGWKGKCLFELMQFDQAIISFEHYLKFSQNDLEQRTNVSQCYYSILANISSTEEQKINLEKASSNLQEILKIDKECCPAYYGLAMVLVKQNQIMKAIQTLYKLIHLQPDNIEAHFELGKLLNNSQGLIHFRLAQVDQVSLQMISDKI